MTYPEQPTSHSVEREPHTPELYSYLSVLEALSLHGVPTDDITFIGGVVERWSENLPSWGIIQDIRRLYADFDAFNDASQQAKQLLQQAEQVLTKDYWDQSEQALACGSDILRRRPGQFYAKDLQSKKLFTIEALSLADNQTGPAELLVAGAEDTDMHQELSLKMYVDATQLNEKERDAIAQYVSDVEITSL